MLDDLSTIYQRDIVDAGKQPQFIYTAIALGTTRYDSLLALLFGIGAALTLDEFALWLRLKDVYWTRQGRASIDADVIVAVLLALSILGWGFWIDLSVVIGDAFGA